MKILYSVCALLLIYVLLSVGTIVKNGVPLTSDPGLWQRLKRFLSTNTAQTADDHTYPELVTPRYSLQPKELRQRVIQATTDLGWQLNEDSDNELKFIVTTALARFKDDITINILAHDQGSALHVVSQSRVGRADFGANVAHILKLRQRLDALATQ